jgi:hypothetical protein
MGKEEPPISSPETHRLRCVNALGHLGRHYDLPGHEVGQYASAPILLPPATPTGRCPIELPSSCYPGLV